MNEQNAVSEQLRYETNEAFEALIREHQFYIFRLILKYMNEREIAYEFTQEVFLKAYLARESYNPIYPFRAWIIKIARNHVGDYWRRKKIRTVPFDRSGRYDGKAYSIDIPSDDTPIPDSYEMKEMARKSREALSKLPAELRDIFLLIYYQELTYEEISEIKNIPVGTVKSCVFRGKDRLRKLIGRLN